MRIKERLLICESCGAEGYFSRAELKGFCEIDCECPNCGDNHHYDYGWIEVETEPNMHDALARLLNS